MFVPPTPGGVLAKELRKREEELNRNNPERIKIEEKGGLKIKDILTSKDPFKNQNVYKSHAPYVQTVKVLIPTPKSKSHATPTMWDIDGHALLARKGVSQRFMKGRLADQLGHAELST